MSETRKISVERSFHSGEVELSELEEAVARMRADGIEPDRLEVQDEYDDAKYIVLVGRRDESEAERATREDRERARRAMAEREDRKLYENLKKRFEP